MMSEAARPIQPYSSRLTRRAGAYAYRSDLGAGVGRRGPIYVAGSKPQGAHGLPLRPPGDQPGILTLAEIRIEI